ELAKAKKVFQDKDNLTMKLVQYTRDDLERAIVDLVKISDVKKPVKSKAKVEAKKVVQDKDNLTMKLVQYTRDDLERAIVDLVKLSDVKKPVKSKAKVEAKKESNT
ncbi:SH3 domain-containing protein, partial (plasmid) [Clostridium perfringens]